MVEKSFFKLVRCLPMTPLRYRFNGKTVAIVILVDWRCNNNLFVRGFISINENGLWIFTTRVRLASNFGLRGWKTKSLSPESFESGGYWNSNNGYDRACATPIPRRLIAFGRVLPPLSILLSIIFTDKAFYLYYTYFVNYYSSMNSININHRRWLDENLKVEQIFFFKFFQKKKKQLHKYNVSFNLFVHIFFINAWPVMTVKWNDALH